MEQKAIRDEIIKKTFRAADRSAGQRGGAAGVIETEGERQRSVLAVAGGQPKDSLGTKVEIKSEAAGSILIYFYSDEELDRFWRFWDSHPGIYHLTFS